MSSFFFNSDMCTVMNYQDYKDCYDVGMQEKVNMFRLQKELEKAEAARTKK